jgi:hypothetical protein
MNSNEIFEELGIWGVALIDQDGGLYYVPHENFEKEELHALRIDSFWKAHISTMVEHPKGGIIVGVYENKGEIYNWNIIGSYGKKAAAFRGELHHPNKDKDIPFGPAEVTDLYFGKKGLCYVTGNYWLFATINERHLKPNDGLFENACKQLIPYREFKKRGYLDVNSITSLEKNWFLCVSTEKEGIIVKLERSNKGFFKFGEEVLKFEKYSPFTKARILGYDGKKSAHGVKWLHPSP